MKRILIPATILAMLSLTTVSCQKEVLTEPTLPTVENSATRTIRYTVDGTAYRQVIHSEEDLDALISTLFALAREGYTVRVMNKILMQKVEELTLHLIELQKQIDELKNNKEE